ncbi:response regulator transcription factor [Modestobacter sp. DSM 44400]|uniref:response regulator transcription factor n=1 Tax=Modestobacter sp. DSM 44400 TaxID=1550230 RepID=UPI0027386D99|nr:response regulator transcription factor [Modestobacter sp. DSM 44400]
MVEDEPKMARLLGRSLTEQGYVVDVAGDGASGYAVAARTSYDVVVLDVMLPRMSGLEVCRRLRAGGAWAPVLFLTARDGLPDRVAGLDTGGDDYLVKPFHFDELLARLRALIRRGPVQRPAVFTAGELRLDPASRRCWRGEREIVLTGKEFALLEVLLRSPGVVIPREVLLEHCWDAGYRSRSNVVDVHIRALRDKIDRPFGVAALETVRGVGYRMRPDGGRPPQ